MNAYFLRRLAFWLFPALCLVFLLSYLNNFNAYRNSLREDNLVEWITFFCLFAAGIVALILAIRIQRRYRYTHWFFVLFFAFNLLAGFEEISWGQRVLNLESGDFFKKYSDQQEINLHNTYQGIANISWLKTKHIALLVLFIYGFLLPLFLKREKINLNSLDHQQLVLPPRFLLFGFLTGSILMLDFQTGHEEEIGEMFYSLCFLLMNLYYLGKFRDELDFQPRFVERYRASKPSFKA